MRVRSTTFNPDSGGIGAPAGQASGFLDERASSVKAAGNLGRRTTPSICRRQGVTFPVPPPFYTGGMSTETVVMDLDRTAWLPFSGGELEGRVPETLCPVCRARRAGASSTSAAGSRRGRNADAGRAGRAGDGASHGAAEGERRTLCFGCYRAQLDRERALRAAASLDTASEERFDGLRPFAPVDRARLAGLRAERAAAAAREHPFANRRRRAQIAARHALERIGEGLRRRAPHLASAPARGSRAHGAPELPASWLPFVASAADGGGRP
jgi:hypothetical protein